jgi:protein O-GlcNAc transferase
MDSNALAVALQHHQAGRLQLAEQIYRQILELDSQHAEAWHYLGVVAYQSGRGQVAVECLRRSIVLDAEVAAVHGNLGLAYQAVGQTSAAMVSFRQALTLDPSFASAHSNLGNVLVDLEKFDEAAACYRRALELKPDYAEAAHNLGSALHSLGKLDEAVACYRKALQLKPDLAEVHSGSHGVLQFKQRYAEAENDLGAALQTQGKLEDAIVCYRRALKFKPDFVEAYSNLGGAIQTRNDLSEGDLAEAEACCRRAIALKADNAAAYNNLGGVLRMGGKLDEAIACYQRALELAPDIRDAYENLGGMLQVHGKLDAAAACYRRAVERIPDFAVAHSSLFCALQYRDGVTLSELAEAHADYQRRHATPLQTAWRPHNHVRDARRRLRLGFVSPDLWRHPVGDFLVRVLENLDSCQAETICYSDRKIPDEQTQRMRTAATTWRDAAGWSDERLADQIRADQIDILFDLAGHTYGNRLLVFARKPAPIQIAWIGYVGTTGLQAMDYILADRYEIPWEAERHYCERVLRMPDGYVCYEPRAAPPVSTLPALDVGHVTLGCFNNSVKMTSRAIEVWSQILHRLPDARLALRVRLKNDPALVERFVEGFAAEGIDASRLDLSSELPYFEHLADYRRIDLALDPFPFSGGVSTCEALWMGVPVVTCPGETFASRHSLSHLSNVGLTETIARDLDEYVELAVALASDLPRLATLRAGLRERMAASPLCDGERFAKNLMVLLREVWRDWIGRTAEVKKSFHDSDSHRGTSLSHQRA